VLSVETGTVPNETSTTLTVLTRIDTAYDTHRNPGNYGDTLLNPQSHA